MATEVRDVNSRDRVSEVRFQDVEGFADRIRELIPVAPIGTLAFALALLLLSSCSLKKFAIRQVGDAISSGGTSTFEEDDDVELVEGALPFSLKLTESLLAETPRHRGLLLTAAKGFVLYSYAYVDFESELLADDDFRRSRAMRKRARALYRRAYRYGMRGLETRYKGLESLLVEDPPGAAALVRGKKHDIDLLYWTAAALGLAISNAKDDPRLMARVPEVEALIHRAIELDSDWDDGALHEFLVSLESAKPGAVDLSAIRTNYERALELSDGRSASLFVSFAEAYSLPERNRSEFEQLLERALSIDPDSVPERKLQTLLTQRRALWLQGKLDDLFFELEEEAENESAN